MSNDDLLMVNRVFVGGIPFQADEEQLKGYFEEFGPVLEVKVIRDRETGNSKGYGFVTFESQETAENVRQQTSLSFLGKNMNVSEAYRKHKQQRQHNVPQAAIPPRGYVVYGPSHRTPRMYPPAPAAVPPGYSIYYGLPPPGPHYAMAGYGYGYAMPPGAYVNAPPEVMDLRAMQEALPQIAQLTQIPGMPPMQYNTTAASNEMRRVPRASVPPRQQPQPNPRPAQEYAQ